MDSLYLLIPIALIFCALAIRLLIWAIDSGQYDDLDKDAWRILAEPPPETGGPDPEAASETADCASADQADNDERTCTAEDAEGQQEQAR